MFTTIKCGNREVNLRYRSKSLIELQNSASSVIGPDRVQDIFREIELNKLRSRFAAITTAEQFDKLLTTFEHTFPPVNTKRRIGIDLVLACLGDFEVLIYVFGKGLDWDGSNAKPAEAYQLFDDYMASGEPDTGEKLQFFIESISEAINYAAGISIKNLKEKRKTPPPKIAEEEPATESEPTEEPNGTGKVPSSYAPPDSD